MGSNVHENKTRKMIINHIIIHPGVSFNIIKKVFGLTEGNLRYHLNYLENRKEITSALIGNRRYYYPNHEYVFTSRSESEVGIHELNDSKRRLLNTIKRNPGVSQKELIYKTGMKRITLAYNINKLLDLSIIRKVQNGKFACYYYIDDAELRKRIMKRLIADFLNYKLDEKTFLALKRKLE